MGIPYISAYRALKIGTLSWSQYIDNLLVTNTGEPYQDEAEVIHSDIYKDENDPFGYLMYCWLRPIQRYGGNRYNTTPIKAVFMAYRQQASMADLQEKLAKVPPELEPIKGVTTCLAFLALQERRADVLELCLQTRGIKYSGHFFDEADKVDENKDPETFRVLEESPFRKKYPKPADGNSAAKYVSPAATFDMGGRLPVLW